MEADRDLASCCIAMAATIKDNGIKISHMDMENTTVQIARGFTKESGRQVLSKAKERRPIPMVPFSRVTSMRALRKERASSYLQMTANMMKRTVNPAI